MKYSLKEALELSKDNKLKLGDKFNFKLYTGEKITAEVMGLHHDRLAYGGTATANATCRFTIDGEYEMNEEWTNEGGWAKSKMRTEYCKRLFKLLPEELQEQIQAVRKTTTKGNGSKELQTTSDRLFLLSLTETVGDKDWNSYVKEGEQYELFKQKGYSFNKWSWLRSPYVDGTYFFRCVNSIGTYGIDGAYYSHGVCFAFCI